MGQILVQNLRIYDDDKSDRSVIATWSPPKGYESTVDHYDVLWYYWTKAYPTKSFRASDTAETAHSCQSSYTAPDTAFKICIRVKTFSKKHKVNGKEVDYWQGATAQVDHEFKVSKPKQLDPIPKEGISMWIEANTERTIRASWEWSQAHTAGFLVTWQYGDGKSGRWYDGTEESVTRTISSYTPPDSAFHVRVRVLPIAETRQEYGEEVAYWTATVSLWQEYRFEAAPTPSKGQITDITLELEPGTDRNLVATWKWSAQHTASYSVQWEYASGIGWLHGKETDGLTLKEDTYAPGTNARKARFRVLPVAEEHSDNGVIVPYWKADWSDWVKYLFIAEDPPQVGTVTNLWLKLQSGTDRTLYATWQWDRDHTANYTVEWGYDTGDNVWFESGSDTVTAKQDTHNAESNAKRIRVRVKPNAETHSDHGQTVAYWDAQYTDWVEYTFTETVSTPMVPSVTIDQYTLTAEVDVYDENIVQVEFQVIENNTTTFATGTANVVANHASYSCHINPGNEYRVRCRGISATGVVSEWSENSGVVGTPPSAPTSILSCRALSSSSVELTWEAVANAEEYEVEYTNNKLYFDASSSVQSTSVPKNSNRAVVTGLDTGEEWFFRVRATNRNGESGWTDIVSVVLGKKPSAPTTWSQTSTGIVGDNIILYWVHNSEDGSRQKSAQIGIAVNGLETIKTIDTPSEPEDDEDEPINSYVLATGSYSSGAEIKWRVRTMGITGEYGDWSTVRTIKIYAPPSMMLNAGSFPENILSRFPYLINVSVGPLTQTPVGYYLTVFSNEEYNTLNSVGEEVWVGKGEQIYAKYFNVTEHTLSVNLTASDIDLENNMEYLLRCEVYMDSGLSASAERTFTVRWEVHDYITNAEVGINWDNLTTYIHPYCVTYDGVLVEDVVLSVYRREFDGTFTLIADNIENQHIDLDGLLDSRGEFIYDSTSVIAFSRDVTKTNTFATDPHPSLDYARYRIVATSTATGEIDFFDLPAYPIGEVSAVLQWNEKWSSFVDPEETEYGKPVWVGSMLKLPYNLDVSEEGKVDHSLVEYIGREHPVSYYGTQRGSTSTWNVDVVKEDTETLYQLRRLQRYAGDVYVREPSGLGYWANVQVSFNQTHCELVIPVTLTITRVEGGA